jgi:DNA polymerase II small subunit
MAGENLDNPVRELARVLSQSRIVLSGSINESLLREVNLDLLASKVIESKAESVASLNIVSAEEISAIINMMKVDKTPVPIEVIRSTDFKPEAADIDARYKVNNRPNDRSSGSAADFVSYFSNRLTKIKALIETHRNYILLPSIDSMKSLTSGREVCIAGIVTSKIVTKKGNIMVTIEDETGESKVMFMAGTSQQARELLQKSQSIINDEVIAVRGKISNIFVIASEMIWPDIPITKRKEVADDIAIAFMSDIHVGSKRFMQKNFEHAIQWLNGNVEEKRDIAAKIKYIIMAGDVADGIGVYPGQENDLAIFDIYDQYSMLFKYIDAIPDYIHVFVMPGNHDAVQRAEPQPPLTSELMRDFRKDNVHILSNPSWVNAHGLDILAYHGTSLDSIISAIPGTSYAAPERAMIEVLKRRHLSPIYGGNVIVPSKEDNLVIEKVPDIMHFGHIHKNAIADYHGVGIVNSGTWQARTDFQIRQGHIPSPCVLPVYEAKSQAFSQINFNNEQ